MTEGGPAWDAGIGIRSADAADTWVLKMTLVLRTIAAVEFVTEPLTWMMILSTSSGDVHERVTQPATTPATTDCMPVVDEEEVVAMGLWCGTLEGSDGVTVAEAALEEEVACMNNEVLGFVGLTLLVDFRSSG
jgi:hypothetical protein